MGIEENKEVVRQAFTQVVQNKLDYFTSDYVEHFTDKDRSFEDTKRGVAKFLKAFSDVNTTFDLVVAEGDMVAVRETLHGTHTGQFMGVSPTGKQVKICNNFIAKVVDGKIAEMWTTEDSLSLMQQIGVLLPTEEIGK